MSADIQIALVENLHAPFAVGGVIEKENATEGVVGDQRRVVGGRGIVEFIIAILGGENRPVSRRRAVFGKKIEAASPKSVITKFCVIPELFVIPKAADYIVLEE